MRHITTHEFEFTEEEIEKMLVSASLVTLSDNNKDHYAIEVTKNEGITTVRLAVQSLATNEVIENKSRSKKSLTR